MSNDLPMELITQGPKSPCFIFAHGAGAPMDSEFMEQVTGLLVDRDIGVVRFEFPYMQQRRYGGKKRPPNRQSELLEHWRNVLMHVAEQQSCQVSDVFIGGKSMGGRMASLIADEVKAAGLICLGYPFHPPSKPEKLRTEHLKTLQTKTLIVQGTRDPLGKIEEVKTYSLSSQVRVEWLEDGDHDLKPRVKSGFTHDQHLEALADSVAEFIFRC